MPETSTGHTPSPNATTRDGSGVRAAVVLVVLATAVLIGGVAARLAAAGDSSVDVGAIPSVNIVHPHQQHIAHADGALSHPPTEVDIPAIGVHSSLLGLRVGRHGALQPPSNFRQVGWYRDGTAPGDRGPAILIGHVDSYRGSAVFARIRDLRPRDRVTIDRADGSTAIFAVDALREFAKSHFPTALVYGPDRYRTLRLITCGGAFDRSSGHYDDNIVAFAHLIKIRR